MRHRPTSRWFLAGALVLAGATIPTTSRLHAQQRQGISPQAVAQMSALVAEKRSRTPAQRKIDSNLLYGAKMARREAIAQGVQALEVYLPDQTKDGVAVDVRAQVSQGLLNQLIGLGAQIMDVSARYENIRLRIDLTKIESIAALPQVRHIMPKQEALTQRVDVLDLPAATTAAPLTGLERVNRAKARKIQDRAALIASVRTALGQSQDGPITNVGSQESQGDWKHNAVAARSRFGVSGAGVKVGVLSDGVTSLTSSQGLGDLGPVTVLPGQAGSGDEGTAMLEIIHDLAPNAQLYFATAFTSISSFAQNIRDLRTAGCDIIVDDVGYFAETPFQDGQTGTSSTNGGVVIQSVKDVTAAGALYFSSAANSGNKNDAQSGTWEGDYVDGGPAGAPITGITGESGNLHDFGGGQLYDVMTVGSGNPISLHWSDPLGSAANDYDLFRLDSTGATVLAVSNAVQDGTPGDDPFEIMSGAGSGNNNQRIVILNYLGTQAGRFFHLDTNRARLGTSTAGNTHGHAATSAPYSFGVAATSAQINGLNPFNNTHVIETFSSDGPRHIFFMQDGTAITPGNFSSTGGSTLQKPDLTAADGVSVTGVGGFPNPFFGTSAAAPHAAAIAALIKSRNLALTQAQIKAALFASAIDIEGAGVDRDSGVGIIMADSAVGAVPGPTTHPAGDFDGDTKNDITVFRPSSGQWFVLKSGANFTTFSTVNWGVSTDVPVPGDYDGDGKLDIAVFRPSTGQWFVLTSSSNFTAFATYNFGVSTDIPVQADYDGDGKTDITVFRPSTGQWFILKSSTNFTLYSIYNWGLSTDKPAVGDYDGDGKADITIFRPSSGQWYVLKSSSNFTTFSVFNFGGGSDIPVPGDYDGDAKTDVAVYRPSSGTWFVLKSSTNFTSYSSYGWGVSTDIPVPGDYDGDAKTDIAVFRPSSGQWFVLKSSSGFTAFNSYNWGASSDIPINKRQ
jgi:hypothetical protein